MRRLTVFFVALVVLMLTACDNDQITNPPDTPPQVLSQVAIITANSFGWDIACAFIDQTVELAPKTRGIVCYPTGSAYELRFKVITKVQVEEFQVYYYKKEALSSCPAQWDGDLFNSYEYQGSFSSSGGEDDGIWAIVIKEKIEVIFPAASYAVKIIEVRPRNDV